MRSAAPMRTAKIGYIVISAILCAMGITLIAVPEFSAALIGRICGITLMIFGCVKLIGYFSKDLYRLAFQYDLAFGILMIVLGVVLMVRPGGLMNFISLILGISILADSLFKIQIALESRRFGISKWWLILACALITGAFGLILLFRPEEGSVLTVLLGISLLSEGILNLGTVLTAVKIIKHQQPDEADVIYYKERED